MTIEVFQKHTTACEMSMAYNRKCGFNCKWRIRLNFGPHTSILEEIFTIKLNAVEYAMRLKSDIVTTSTGFYAPPDEPVERPKYEKEISQLEGIIKALKEEK